MCSKCNLGRWILSVKFSDQTSQCAQINNAIDFSQINFFQYGGLVKKISVKMDYLILGFELFQGCHINECNIWQPCHGDMAGLQPTWTVTKNSCLKRITEERDETLKSINIPHKSSSTIFFTLNIIYTYFLSDFFLPVIKILFSSPPKTSEALLQVSVADTQATLQFSIAEIQAFLKLTHRLCCRLVSKIMLFSSFLFQNLRPAVVLKPWQHANGGTPHPAIYILRQEHPLTKTPEPFSSPRTGLNNTLCTYMYMIGSVHIRHNKLTPRCFTQAMGSITSPPVQEIIMSFWWDKLDLVNWVKKIPEIKDKTLKKIIWKQDERR
ncbi:hypothetical protein VP01_1777g1 [Puccinia sorghi]|uniref:Uncharacterized protein n=1 Tax=Puccinia sorghi TaxID=27349 RepID=A0A0L6VET4_9BASI|nr:hypothetical protein VP01_1777g1 [Puccinia sorghi]